MKKFITFTLCLLLCVASFGLTACGGKKDKVDTSVASMGNGGMVVTSGDYVYFVNGYSSYEVFTKKNLDKNFDVAGLYRAKLNSNGEFNYTDNGSIDGAEKISGDLAGFQSTSLYVFGNYIYYVTPTTEVNKKGELQTSRLDFYRISIGGGKAKRIYRSSESASNIKFEYYYADGSVYLMVKENTTLKRIKATGKVSVSTVAKDVTSLVLPRDTDDIFTSESYKNIYYTKTNDDGKIEIYNYNALANKNEYKKTTDYKTCELVDYKFDHLYYKASHNDALGLSLYYRVDATKNAIQALSSTEEKLTSDDSYTKFYFLDNETSGYITQSADKTYYITYNASGLGEAKPIADAIEIIGIKNNCIYFKKDNDIKRINCFKFKTEGNKTQETIITIDNLKTHSYDIDENNLYVYATQGSNDYLYSVNIGNVVAGHKVEKQLLGVYNDSDAPSNE